MWLHTHGGSNVHQIQSWKMSKRDKFRQVIDLVMRFYSADIWHDIISYTSPKSQVTSVLYLKPQQWHHQLCRPLKPPKIRYNRLNSGISEMEGFWYLCIHWQSVQFLPLSVNAVNSKCFINSQHLLDISPGNRWPVEKYGVKLYFC